MSRRPSRLAVLVTAAVLAGLVLPATLHAQALDNLLGAYNDVSSQWLGQLQPMAQVLFGILATLELAMSAALWLLRRNDGEGMLLALLRRFLLLGVCYTLLSFFPLWVPRITQGFSHAGQSLSHTTGLGPSSILDLGIDLAGDILLAAGSAGFLTNPSGNIVGSLTGLIVLLAYVLIAAQLVVVIAESYIVLSTGIFFLAFSPSRLTAPIADRFLVYAFQVGIKLFFLYLLVAVAPKLSAGWIALVRQGSFPFDLRPFFEVLASALAYALLCWRIPNHIAAQLTSGASFGLVEALRSE